jgi:polygalacturonase
MLGLGRVLIVMLVALSVVYVCLFFYLRSGARMRLEEDWVQAGRPDDRETWVDARLGAVASRIRVWLVVAVYVMPVVGLTAFVWFTN